MSSITKEEFMAALEVVRKDAKAEQDALKAELEKVRADMQSGTKEDRKPKDEFHRRTSETFYSYYLQKVKSGKPDRFQGQRAEFKTFIKSLGNWAHRAYPQARDCIYWAVQQTEEIDWQ